ncbi:TatD family hydrolase [Desulfovibrio aminophilus]|nr:TatD family hydrolase [Desulfovibrio aminophilus]MCM0755752.1 TatD family hydrolase [Desulfovibrio aminophilus]
MSKKHKARPEPESLGLPQGGVDTHAHLDMQAYEMGLETVLDRARASGLSRIGNVFLGPDAYLEHRSLFAARPEVFFLLAEHPNDTAGFDESRAQRLLDCLRGDPRIRAVGETGLDFYWKDVAPEEQERAFRLHLDLARQTDLPPVIHCRDAEERTLAVLDDMGFRDRPLLWHCFGGNADLAREIVARGWHVSVPGTVTYARNEALRAAVPGIPSDRLVLETDCPYLTPEPWRGKQNHPALVGFTAVAVAGLRGVPAGELWTMCADNARRFFGL